VNNPPIAVLVFENHTEEPILERDLFPIFKAELARRQIVMTSDSRDAAFILSGKIVRFEAIFKSLNAAGGASEFGITVGVEYLLYEQGKAEPALKTNLTESADYYMSGNPLVDRDARDRAFREASQRLSEKAAGQVSAFLSGKMH
jgi:hypothetical protein